MPGLIPGRRWQPAYLPFHDEPLFDRAVEAVVPRLVKEAGLSRAPAASAPVPDGS